MIRAIANSGALAAAVLWSTSASAITTPQYPVPYIGIGPSALSPDSARSADAVGGGYQLYGGLPVDWLAEGREALELRIFDHEMERKFDSEPNYTTAFTLDYVYDFGSRARTEGFLRGSKFFVMGGGGLARESNFGDEGTYMVVNAGAGLLIPLGFKGWGVRVDGTMQIVSNKDACDSEAVAANFCESEASKFTDVFVSAQLQIPLTIFFERPKELPPATECPVAVVGEQQRADCAADSDRDGVADGQDQCPGSTMGDTVDEKGCTVVRQVQ